MKQLQFVVYTITMLLLIGGVAKAGVVLFGAAAEECAGATPGGSGPSNLYGIDPNSGVANLIGPIGFQGVTGLAFLNDGRLVASARQADEGGDRIAILIQINPATGQGSLIGEIDRQSTGGCGRMPDITFDPESNTLFGYGDNCDDDDSLYTINTSTGAGTLIGTTGFGSGGNGLAWELSTNTLFATPQDDLSLVIINPNDGSGTSVPGSEGNVPVRVNALAFDPTTGVLFGSRRELPSNWFLVTINTSNGVTSTIGQTVDCLDAIIFQPRPPAPIPTLNQWGKIVTISVIGLFAVMGIFAMRRRSAVKS